MTVANLTNSGIIIGNRGQNDDAIKIAAIKSLTGGNNVGGGTNYIYDDVLQFNSTWTQKGVNGGALSGSYTPTTVLSSMNSVALRRRDLSGVLDGQLDPASVPAISSFIAPQDVKAMFLTFADLGLQVGDTFYGYSVIPSDANVGGSSDNVNSYLNSSIYPNDTPNTTGGADISAINGYFFNQNALPVSLISFTARAQTNQTVLLEWATSWERNNKGYILERSKDLITFERAGQVSDVAGTTNSINRYRFVDSAPFLGTSYYRLTQVDLDGTTKVFPAVSVVLRTEAYGIFPNPTRDGQFTLNLDEPLMATVNLYAADGRQVGLQKSGHTDSSLQLKTTQSLTAGPYVLMVTERGQTRQYRIIIN